jgi:4-amino-4-deoxychorismate lyase
VPPHAGTASLALRALIDGIETDRLPVDDRGLQYGDGVFETIAVREGGLCLWREHFDRLCRGSVRLGIPCPSQDLLLRESLRLINGETARVLKIILTRGSSGRGYCASKSAQPSRILTLHPRPDYPAAWRKEGVVAIFCRTPLGENPVLAGFKHLNRLEQVLGRSEWRDHEIAEGLMQDVRGRIIGGTMSNLFLVSPGRLLTPRIDTCGVAGTVRSLVLRLAGGFGIEMLEAEILPEDLEAADGLFLTNSLIGVWPVRRLGEGEKAPENLPGDLIAAVRQAAETPSGGWTDGCE